MYISCLLVLLSYVLFTHERVDHVERHVYTCCCRRNRLIAHFSVIRFGCSSQACFVGSQNVDEANQFLLARCLNVARQRGQSFEYLFPSFCALLSDGCSLDEFRSVQDLVHYRRKTPHNQIQLNLPLSSSSPSLSASSNAAVI